MILYGSDMLAPIELLGPIVNFVFLRYISAGKDSETSQEKKVQLENNQNERNSFWPGLDQLANQWMLTVLGVGMAGAGLAVGYVS